MADKTFAQPNAGEQQFPHMRFERPIEVDPTKLVKTVADTGVELYANKVASDLEGGGIEPGPANDPTLPKSGMDAISSDVDSELNLSKIAKMRQQGLLTASGAKIMAAKAVQSASARLPGKAPEFRRQAAAFFGDFGPGVDLLDQTAAEKNAMAEGKHLDQLAINNGLFNVGADGTPIVTNDHRATVKNILLQTSQIELNNKQIENAFTNGKVTAANAAAYSTNIAHTSSLGIIGAIQARIANDGSIMKPEEIDNQIGLAKQQAHAAVDDRLQGTLVDPSQRQQLHTGVDDYFKNIEGLVKSQSFSTIMKNNKEGLTSYLSVAGAKAFPALALAEAAAPGTGAKFVVDTMQRMQNMNKDQLDNWYKNDPSAAIVGGFQQQLPTLINGLKNITSGMLPVKGAPDYNATVLGATSLAIDKDPNTTPEQKQKGIDILNKSVASGDRQSIYVMGDPRVAVNTTPEQRKQLVFGLAGEVAKVRMALPAMLSEAKNAMFQGDVPIKDILTYDNGEVKFNPLVKTGSYNDLLSGPTDIKAAALQSSPEILNSVKTLNAVSKVLQTYSTSPEFERALAGKTPDEYMRGLIGDVHATTEEHNKASTERKKQIESGRIDSWRGATPKESLMPQPQSSITPQENSDINTQIAALQARQKDLEALARAKGATEQDITGTGPAQ